jgi:hypothetical protein
VLSWTRFHHEHTAHAIKKKELLQRLPPAIQVSDVCNVRNMELPTIKNLQRLPPAIRQRLPPAILPSGRALE